MKKQLIATFVGSLILFFWQFFSWALLGIHDSQMSYTPKQDVILEALAAADLEEGSYFIPRTPPGSSSEVEKAFYDKQFGKPWALVSYRKSFENNQGMNMLRGWAVNFVAVFLLCWVLLKMADLDFKTALLSSLAVGLISYLTIPYINTIWFEGTSIPDLIDALVQWGVCGAWLGFWLTRD